MATFVSDGLPLPGGIEAIFPARQASDLDQDVIAHKRGDRFCQTAFTVLDGGTADAELPGTQAVSSGLNATIQPRPPPAPPPAQPHPAEARQDYEAAVLRGQR